jgi:putative ATP-dependent endonuclease of OLD family
MLLRRIEVAEFRGLKMASVELDPTTALIGENSAGKSTLLDAIAICCSGRDDRVRLEVRDFRQVGDRPPSETLSIALTYEEADGEWQLPPWEPFRPFIRLAPDGRRILRLEVRGARDPGNNGVSARWSFAGFDPGRGEPAGLLAAWRRLCPILRLRANRYVEEDPRGEAEVVGARAESQPAQAEDPVVRQAEYQIRLVYDRLTGASDIQEDEVRRALDAAESFLVGRVPDRSMPPKLPPLMSELAETPVRGGRRQESLLSTIKQGRGSRGLALIGLVGAILEARPRQPLTAGMQPLLVMEDIEAHLHPTTMSAMWELVERIPTQKIVTTNSGDLLAAVPLRAIRRIVTDGRGTRTYRIDSARYSIDDLRHIAYHVRLNRAGSLFARCWLFVEGETEAWLLPELAQISGYDFPSEGIRCVEFAQSGLKSLLRLANDFGIEWHLLTDGDQAGRAYVATARAQLRGRAFEDRVTRLDETDIEHCLYYGGYAGLYQGMAGAPAVGPHGRRAREKASGIIARAIRARSKPGLALAVLEAANKPGSPGVPRQLRDLIETVVRLARPAE